MELDPNVCPRVLEQMLVIHIQFSLLCNYVSSHHCAIYLYIYIYFTHLSISYDRFIIYKA